MKSTIICCLSMFSLSFVFKANEVTMPRPFDEITSHQKVLDLILDIKNETTHEQWELFCDIMSYTRDSDFYAYAKTLNPQKYTTSSPKAFVVLSEDDALYYAKWLTKHGKDKNYLQQILQQIADCPAPTASEILIDNLCASLMRPEQDNSETSVGMNYHKTLWKLACATPKIDPTEVGRAKVKRYWNKHKREIRCPTTGTRDTDDLSVAKHAMDCSSIRFTRELAIAYKVDFNFVDKKDGLTILDFVQKRIDQANRLVPKPEQTLIEYQAVYDAIVRAGGKHKKDLKPEEY